MKSSSAKQFIDQTTSVVVSTQLTSNTSSNVSQIPNSPNNQTLCQFLIDGNVYWSATVSSANTSSSLLNNVGNAKASFVGGTPTPPIGETPCSIQYLATGAGNYNVIFNGTIIDSESGNNFSGTIIGNFAIN